MVNENYKQFDILWERIDEIVDTTQKAVSSLNTYTVFRNGLIILILKIEIQKKSIVSMKILFKVMSIL
jgi:hypothetical protein